MPGDDARIYSRQTGGSTQFLDLVANPFQSQIQSKALYASLGTSLGFTLLIALIFCFLRPYNQVVYAPRLKHADEKHAPPLVGKGVFAWVLPVIKTEEQLLVDKVGLDAAVFLRFAKMCRNMFLVASVVGCGILIPINITGGKGLYGSFSDVAVLMKMTPQYMFGEIFWVHVVCAYLFDIIICYFLWTNYRAVTRLRRAYFDSPEYQASLHARTLMVTDIPKSLRTDDGVVRITESMMSTSSNPRAAIGRNLKELPKYFKQHEEAVRELESILAKYLRDPNRLPAKRPTCRPSGGDVKFSRKGKVDAIDYLTTRISDLETRIKEIRESVDQRNAMPYGFASFERISDAHNLAYAAKKKHPQGATVRLAPKPNDLIWDNLALSPKTRRWKTVTNNLWVAVLTVLWIVPNALIAVFLSNLSKLGAVWPAFQAELGRNPTTWAIVQGVAAPAITSLFYFFLPAIFRRLSIRAGDLTKTSRERHVTHKLYAFFVFNNLIIFSLFGAVWIFISAVITARKDPNNDVWEAIQQGRIFNQLMIALCNVSPFWITWLLQRNLGAAVDLSQLYNLVWVGLARKFGNPTPRQLIEWTAPPPFEYASYYNYFLFYATVALCFATLQPLVLPVTAFYFGLDTWLKKYLLLYVFITKTESGGQFWRILVNRLLFATVLSNIIVALVVLANSFNYVMLAVMAPLPFLILGFKYYCKRTFDDQIHFYTKGAMADSDEVVATDKKKRRNDRVHVRFGHPALTKRLMTPMVHAKSQHLLKDIYRGRTNTDPDASNAAVYSDVYDMSRMSHSTPGKPANPSAPFEIVSESQIDLQQYKDRPEFREQFGGEGEIYGVPSDFSRPSTPGSFAGHNRSRSASRDSDRRPLSRDSEGVPGTTYPTGYHRTGSMQRESSLDARSMGHPSPGLQGGDPYGEDYDRVLLQGAAPMGAAASGPWSRVSTPRSTAGFEDDTSYDQFRTGRG